MSTKWFIQSRTLWVNGLVVLLGFMQYGVGTDDISGVLGSSGITSVVIPGINLALRFFKTHEGIGSGGKSILASWTFWFNLGLVLLGLYMMISGVASAVSIGLMLYGAINIVLRARTDQGLRLMPFEMRR
jgi:hypothetical protein